MERPFCFVIADGAAGSKGGVGWCYWKEGHFYDGHFWLGRQATNVMELFAIYIALLGLPYGAEVLLWTDSRFSANVLAGREPVSNPDIRNLREMIVEMMVLMDMHATIELVRSERNEIHSHVDRRARQQRQTADMRHARGEL